MRALFTWIQGPTRSLESPQSNSALSNGGRPQRPKKTQRPIVLAPPRCFPQCTTCLDLYPGRRTADGGDWAYRGRSESHTASVDAVVKSAEKGCAGCVVLAALLTLYGIEKRNGASAWVHFYHLPHGRALKLELGRREKTERLLEVFTSTAWDSKCPWYSIGTCDHISGATGSDQAVARVQNWLEQCTRMHEQCTEYSVTYLPSRIVEILGPKKVRLRIPEATTARYACLSHCWGSRPLIRTTSSTLSAFLTGIPWNELPRSFQDAISFTYRLGVKFIWIDSLCIIQDDLEDWRHEGGKMADIYEHSYVTLAASKSSDSSQGCFVESPVESLSSALTFTRVDAESNEYDIHHQKLLGCGTQEQEATKGTLLPIRGQAPTRDFGRSQFSIYTRQPLDHSLSSSSATTSLPLLQRGWFFQERLLSPRIVHFAPHELYFECRKHITCECSELHAASRSTFHTAKLAIAALAPRVQWHRLIAEYTTKHLTFEKDVFPAVQGLAKRMQTLRSSAYHAGLWADTFIRDLAWQCDMPRRRPEQWRAPTWSWASVVGTVSWNDVDAPYRLLANRTAVVEGIDTVAVSGDAFGELKSGVLRLRGLCLAASVVHGYFAKRGKSRLAIIGRDWGSAASKCECRFFPDYALQTAGRYYVPDDTLVRVMRLTQLSKGGRCVCLVLRCVEGDEDGDGEEAVYERVGYAEITNLSSQRDVWEEVGREMGVCVV